MTYRGTCKADWIALGLSQQCERKKHFCLANHKQLPKNSKNEPAMLSHAHETLISLEEFIVSQSFWGVVGWFCSILSWSVLWIPNAFPMDLVSSPNPRCPGKKHRKTHSSPVERPNLPPRNLCHVAGCRTSPQNKKRRFQRFSRRVVKPC